MKIPNGEYKKHFAWGAGNGILFGILLISQIDISEGGIAATVLNALKPLIVDLGLSTFWISSIIFLIGVIGFISLGFEIKEVYDAGKMSITFALLGFFRMFLITMIDSCVSNANEDK